MINSVALIFGKIFLHQTRLIRPFARGMKRTFCRFKNFELIPNSPNYVISFTLVRTPLVLSADLFVSFLANSSLRFFRFIL